MQDNRKLIEGLSNKDLKEALLSIETRLKNFEIFHQKIEELLKKAYLTDYEKNVILWTLEVMEKTNQENWESIENYINVVQKNIAN